MGAGLDYFEKTTALLNRLRQTQMPAIEAAADLCAERIAQGGLVFLFGAGHSRMMCEEMTPRQGGFVTFYGDKGTMEVDSSGKYKMYDKGDKVIDEQTDAHYNNELHIDNFLAAIRNDKPLDLAAEIAEGHKSTLLCQR